MLIIENLDEEFNGITCIFLQLPVVLHSFQNENLKIKKPYVLEDRLIEQKVWSQINLDWTV